MKASGARGGARQLRVRQGRWRPCRDIDAGSAAVDDARGAVSADRGLAEHGNWTGLDLRIHYYNTQGLRAVAADNVVQWGGQTGDRRSAACQARPAHAASGVARRRAAIASGPSNCSTEVSWCWRVLEETLGATPRTLDDAPRIARFIASPPMVKLVDAASRKARGAELGETAPCDNASHCAPTA
jgi:hypothetical protein